MSCPKSSVLFQKYPDQGRDLTKIPVRGKPNSAFPKLTGVSKTLVRNTEVAVQPTLLKSNDDAGNAKMKTRNAVKTNSSAPSGFYKTDLQSPNLNSALRIVKEMKQAANLKAPGHLSSKLADEDKVLRRVNFPYEEHLYHDLIALNVSDIGCSSSEPQVRQKCVRQRDREPDLTEFFTPVFSQEFGIHIRFQSNDIDNLPNESFSMYEHLKTWEAQRY